MAKSCDNGEKSWIYRGVFPIEHSPCNYGVVFKSWAYYDCVVEYKIVVVMPNNYVEMVIEVHYGGITRVPFILTILSHNHKSVLYFLIFVHNFKSS